MAKIYDRCPPAVHERVHALVSLHHPALLAAGLTFDLMFIARGDDDDGVTPVLTHGGVPALALARVISAKDRAKGCSDVEILIDRDRFTDCLEAQKNALLDHELQHFELATDKFGAVTYDGGYRPKVKLRHHDYDFGWFVVVAQRHGAASFEVQQAKAMFDNSGEALFPFMVSMATSPVPLPITTEVQTDPLAEPVEATPVLPAGEPPADLAGEPPAEAPVVETAATRLVKWSFFFGQPSVRKLAPAPVVKDEAATVDLAAGSPAEVHP